LQILEQQRFIEILLCYSIENRNCELHILEQQRFIEIPMIYINIGNRNCELQLLQIKMLTVFQVDEDFQAPEEAVQIID